MTCYSSLFLQVNDGYARSLEILSKKLKFVQVNPLINASKALKDITQELERLRQKALSKVISSGPFTISRSNKPGYGMMFHAHLSLPITPYMFVSS